MKTARILVSLPAIAAALASGCIVLPVPHPRTHAWAREGRVVDASTGAPVAGARVVAFPDCDRVYDTDTNGAFRVAAVRKWHGAAAWAPCACAPMPLFSILPAMHGDSRWIPDQSVRVSAPGYRVYDESRLPSVSVPFRSFSRDGTGRPASPGLSRPVETNLVNARLRRNVCRTWHAPWDDAWPSGAIVGKTIRLLPDGAPDPEPVAGFSICLDLADGAASPDEAEPPQARVLWYGPDLPLEVDAADSIRLGPPPEGPAGAPDVFLRKEVQPFFLAPDSAARVRIELDGGHPVRFSVHTGEPWEPLPADRRAKLVADALRPWHCNVSRQIDAGLALAADRRAEIGAGRVFRVTGCELFGREDSPKTWDALRMLDPRLEIVFSAPAAPGAAEGVRAGGAKPAE